MVLAFEAGHPGWRRVAPAAPAAFLGPDRFLRAWPRIEALGFNEAFRRLWVYYLCYCEAGFRTGYLDVQQFTLTKAH